MTKRLLILLGFTLLFAAPAWAEDDTDGEAQAGEEGTEDADRRKAREQVRALASPRPSIGPAPGLSSNPKAAAAAKTGSADASGNDSGSGSQADGEPTDDPWQGDSDSQVTTGEGEAAESKRKPIQPIPDDVKINIDYDNVDIKDVIKDFSRKTGRNFLIDPKISGKITVHAPLAVPMADAYEVFLAILDANGYATVVEARYKTSDNDYGAAGYPRPRWRKGDPLITRILSAGDARSEPLKLYKGGYVPATSALVTQLIQLNNISAGEVSSVVGKWVSGSGEMVAYEPTNTLILTDSANNITRILELITELDISAPKQKLEVIQIEFAEATRVVEIITEIYGEDGTAQASQAKSSSKSRASKRKASKSKAKARSGATSSVGAADSFIGKMIADERMNSIIVLATEKSLIDIRELVARIDKNTDPFAQGDIHVIYLEHAKAEELSATLNNLVQQSNQRAQQAASQRRGSGSNASAASSRRATPAASGQGGDAGGNFEGEVRLTHDMPTNSLVVTASRDDYARLRKVVGLLDIPRKQVFVETVIMEVSDQKVNDNGVSWHGGGLINGEATSASILAARGGTSMNPVGGLLDGSLLAGLGMGIFGQAIPLPINDPVSGAGLEIPAFGVVMRFLQEDNSTNVLSSPNILTLDNQEATIEIGETVPFPTGGLAGSLGALAGGAGGALGGLGGLPSISFTREDVGIILRITPQINESDWVTMDVYQEISEVKEGSASDASNGGPTTTKRSAETSVSVKSNQTIVIGGLMQEVETESESKIPILGDIPLLGALFRNKRKTKRKTNLLIFLTPHVIDGPEDLQEVYRIKMLQRQEFMRRFYGKTPQEQLEELNELVRYSMNLPDSPSVYRDRPPRPREVMLRFDQAPAKEPEADAGLVESIEDGEGGVLITPDGEFEVDGEGVPDEDTEEGEEPIDPGESEESEESAPSEEPF